LIPLAQASEKGKLGVLKRVAGGTTSKALGARRAKEKKQVAREHQNL